MKKQFTELSRALDAIISGKEPVGLSIQQTKEILVKVYDHLVESPGSGYALLSKIRGGGIAQISALATALQAAMHGDQAADPRAAATATAPVMPEAAPIAKTSTRVAQESAWDKYCRLVENPKTAVQAARFYSDNADEILKSRASPAGPVSQEEIERRVALCKNEFEVYSVLIEVNPTAAGAYYQQFADKILDQRAAANR